MSGVCFIKQIYQISSQTNWNKPGLFGKLVYETVPCRWLNKLRVTGLVLSWQNQTSPIWLSWYHEADHQLSLSTQAWSWVNGARAHECLTSVMSSQSHALKLWFTSRERVSAIHYQRLKTEQYEEHFYTARWNDLSMKEENLKRTSYHISASKSCKVNL